jgi:hypothetical protein
MELICQCGAPAELKREHNPNYSMTWIECTKCPMATVQRGWTGTDASIVDALVFHWNNRRTPAAQDAAQGREVVAYRWLRNGEPVCPWQDGKPGEQQMDRARELIGTADWQPQYAYAESTPATPTTNSGEIGRESVGDVADDAPRFASDAELIGELIDYAESGKAAEPSWLPYMRALLRRLSRREG